MFNFAVVTVSTRAYNRVREDASGPEIIRLLAGYGQVVETVLVPDEKGLIEKALRRLADDVGVDAVFTTGGTGLSPTDVTPEATLMVVDRAVPGIPEAMRAKSLAITDRAMLSRAVAGVRGGTLIVNLPGSPKACRECMDVLLPVLEHGLTVLRGTAEDCNPPVN